MNSFSTLGTTCVSIKCDSTAECVKSLIEKGAICCGYTHMVQLGTNPVGHNPLAAKPSSVNVWNTEYYCGGSGTGNGSVVAAGLVPFSIGVDGIGSNRIVSGNTGCITLKSTFGRVRDKGSILSEGSQFASIGDFYVNKYILGPITKSTRDSAIIYSYIGGPNPDYLLGYEQPPLIIPKLEIVDYTKIRVATCFEFANNADDYMIEALKEVISKIEENGGKVSDITIPELNEAWISTVLEYSQIVTQTLIHKFGDFFYKNLDDANAEMFLELSKRNIPADIDLFDRQRTRTIKIMEKIFTDNDILIIPNTCTIPEKIDQNRYVSRAFDSMSVMTHICFTFLATFTGLPCLTIFVKTHTKSELPLSIQIVSKWWNEELLLNFAGSIERLFPLNLRPKIFKSPLYLNKE